MILYLVRHGQTAWNLENKIQGDTEFPLNETGRRQAQIVSNMLKDISFDICYTSPLSRAKDTAETIIEGKCPMIISKELIERDFGQIEGKQIKEEESKKYWNYQLNSSDLEVEPVRNLLYRTKLFLNQVRNDNMDKTVLVVSHGSTLRALHYNLMGYHENEDFLKLNIGNCQIFKYEI